MHDLAPEVLALARAVQEFVSVTHDDGHLVTQALVAYEAVRVDDDGDTARYVAYAVPTDNWSLSGALGLAEAARYLIRRDSFADEDE